MQGLRERKKAKTYTAIQEHAFRLFRERGYAATTVEQIAAAAEVSQTTFFRYFPAKEDLVLRADFDRAALDEFRDRLNDVAPLEAMRQALAAVHVRMPASEYERWREGTRLVLSVPELRARMLDKFFRTSQLFAEILAEHGGTERDEFAARTFAGALVGVMMTAMITAAEDPDADLAALMDRALSLLSAGLPLSPQALGHPS